MLVNEQSIPAGSFVEEATEQTHADEVDIGHCVAERRTSMLRVANVAHAIVEDLIGRCPRNR